MCRSRDSRAPPALAIRHIPAGGMFIAANPIYGIQDPAVHRRGPDASRMPHVGVLHKCSAFGHRIKARLDDRPHSLACMLRSGSEENTTEAGPPNSRARITPICAASPLTTAARGNLRLRAPLRIRDLTEDDWLNGLWPSAAMLAQMLRPGFRGMIPRSALTRCAISWRDGALIRLRALSARARHYQSDRRPVGSGPRKHARRGDERVLLPCFSRSLSGLLRRALRWIRLLNPHFFSAASHISAER